MSHAFIACSNQSVSSFRCNAHEIYTQTPQLTLADARNGKPTTIPAKITYMVYKENIDPSHILAFTYSKESARKMLEKVKKLLLGKEVIVKTYSFCASDA